MTQDRPQTKRHSRKAFAGITAVIALLTLVTFALVEKNPEKPSAILSYAGNEAGRISATLQDGSGITELSAGDGNFDLPAAQKISLPYIVSSSFYSGDDAGAQDFVFTVSQDRKKISVLIDGFGADDTVTLALNGRASFTDIPMDWSGRMEFVSDLNEDKSIKACVEINGRDIKVCHQIPEGLGA